MGDRARSDHVVHVLTPGDHYSPSTGSAVATVVHGLNAHRPPSVSMPAVAVATGTYPDRYVDADILEYPLAPAGRYDRHIDAVRGRAGLPRTRMRDRYRQVLRQQHDWDPSVIVGHNAVQLPGVVDLSRHAAVLYAHNDLLRTYSRREAGRALEPTAAIVAVSDYLADTLMRSLPARLHERVTVVRNGVDTSLFHPTESAEPSGSLRVVFIGRVIHDKGADVLVDAVRSLGRRDVELSIVGSAGFDPHAPLDAYETDLRRRGGDARITFRHFVPRTEAAALLRAADVVVVPSRWPDPCPLTVLEGMASGAAVIASDIGGIPEMLGDAGVLVRPDDHRHLAEAIDSLAGDPAALAATRERCLAAARQQSWARTSDTFYRAIAARV